MKTIQSVLFGFGLSLTAASCMVGDGVDSNDDEIIGGSLDLQDPSVVAIFAHAPGSNSGALCTGSVISPTAVLTAAHCVDPRAVGSGNVFEVLTGTYAGKGARLAVASTVFDTAFNIADPAAGHDVGIVKLAQPTTLAPLPFGDITSPTGAVRTVGYGVDTHVIGIGLPDGSTTKHKVTTTLNSASATLLDIGNAAQGTCHGDSGGPAFQRGPDGTERIVGLTSFGADLSANVVCISNGFDTRVGAVLSFINANK